MPTNYAQTNVTGEKWTRCGVVTITNPYNRNPSISFREEEVINIGGVEPIFNPKGEIVIAYEPTKEINLINPETGEAIGTMTHEQLFVAFYSAYLEAATWRDNMTAPE